jgi:hypothetical protein
MNDLELRLSAAVRHFWLTRTQQADKQKAAGKSDQGSRGAVAGGAQLDGLAELLAEVLGASGIPDFAIHRKRALELPGYYRPTKKWDLVVVKDRTLLACMELKSHIGPSFGNNFNNRTEEAIGTATDLWTAFREGAFKPSQRPWLGYFMLLEDTRESSTPVKVQEPHFPVFDEFRDSSYTRRYELFCERLVRERLYDSACLLLSNRTAGELGQYREPSEELAFRPFVESLSARALAFARMRS